MAIVKTIVAAMAVLILAAPAYANRPSYQDRQDALRFARDYWEGHGHAEDYGCAPRRITISLYRGPGSEYGKTYPKLYCAEHLPQPQRGMERRWQSREVVECLRHGDPRMGHLVGRGHS